MPPFTAQDVADQCMLQLMFKHKCMLESTAQDVCAQIYGDSSGKSVIAITLNLDIDPRGSDKYGSLQKKII